MYILKLLAIRVGTSIRLVYHEKIPKSTFYSFNSASPQFTTDPSAPIMY